MTAVLYAWRNGVMRVGARCPEGAMALATGGEKRLRRFMCARSRHARDGRTKLVPGVPEAETDRQAFRAVGMFLKWLHQAPVAGITLSPVPHQFRRARLAPILPPGLRVRRTPA